MIEKLSDGTELQFPGGTPAEVVKRTKAAMEAELAPNIVEKLRDGTELQFPRGTSPEVIARAKAAVEAEAAPVEQPAKEESSSALQHLGNLTAGAIRGAGSIGATLVAPYDIAKDALAGKGLSLESNRQRRADMDAALGGMGAETDSWLYQGAKLAGEIAGTAGAGGAAANAVARVAPRVASAGAPVVEAFRTGGLRAGGATGAAGGAARAAGGAGNGALTAAMVNPEDTATGAIVGGMLPSAVQGAGALGNRINQKANKNLAEAVAAFGQNAPKNETVRRAIGAGYVIPPNLVNPSLKNQVIESISGKQATQQLASQANEEVTGKLVRGALGLRTDAPLTKAALAQARELASHPYAEVADLSPGAAQHLELLKLQRNKANQWFNSYNRSANPEDLLKAKEARKSADLLEQDLEQYAKNAERPGLIPALREARKQIAKTYTVGRALNDADGTVDARVLARMYEKGLPLSDGLDTAGRFASAFPTVARTTAGQGSAASHNLKSMASLAAALTGASAAGPLGLSAAAIPFTAPVAARALMFRKGAQEALVKDSPQASQKAVLLAKMLQDPWLQKALVRAAPAAAAQ